MKISRQYIIAGLIAFMTIPLAATAGSVGQSQVTTPDRAVTETRDPHLEYLNSKVRHELLMLPYFTIFDNLGYKVEGNTVTLLGSVTRPVLREDAARVVKKIEGVEQVDNQIEVLPLSNFDDRIRWATARAIYSYPMLNRYGLGTQPSIHIIVKNGNIVLTGVVDNSMDKNVAGLRANSVPGVFSVQNELQVTSPRS